MRLSERRSGVQLHVSSLRSGTLGAEASALLRWLAAAGQSHWQVLPLGPPDRFRSPYKSRSAFACSPRLLARPDATVTLAEEADFCERERYWIGDWADAGAASATQPRRGADRGRAASAARRSSRQRRAVRDQVRFDREWAALRAEAAELGIAIVGDLPLYVAPGSVDHVTHPELFDDALLAGAPPDDFAVHGQLWGNPVYHWPAMQRDGYRWWVERMRRSAALFDLVRLDHFRGLVAYWAVPAGSRDARGGRWRRGPLDAPLLAARRALGQLPLIAEDLGVITPPVERMRQRLGIPGMAVLQFAFDTAGAEERLDEQAAGRVLYTATHDQTTLRGWWEALDDVRRERVLRSLAARSIGRADPHWRLISLAQSTVAPLVMMQAQDVLGLPGSARMNTPGRAGGNWTWRLEAGALSSRLARRLRAATEAAGRLP